MRRHIAALDGLRALAVAAVVVSHAWGSAMPGGWVGVDVFFVLSGYLITTILLGEHARSGRIQLGRFYLRRALRLLPALGAAIVFAVVVAALLWPRSAADTDREALAAIAYVANWAVVAGSFRSGLLTHTWSLSIEEQFYLLWPILLLILLRAGGRRVALWSTLAIVAAVVAHRLTGVSGAYFRTDTRADSLLVGCAVALAASEGLLDRIPAWCTRAAAACGAVALAVVAARVAQPTTVLAEGFGYTLVAIAAATLVVAAAERPCAVLVRALSAPPLVWVGRRSYGVYLYHPVCIAIVSASALGAHGSLTLLAGAPLTLAVAAVSYRYLEQPFLRLKDRPRSQPAAVVAA